MTGHLNRFACQAESKLAEVDRRTQQIQTTLLLLEAKLASIPELEGVKLEESANTDSSAVNAAPPTESVQSAPPVAAADNAEQQSSEQPAEQQTPEPAPGIIIVQIHLYGCCV